MTDIVVPKWGLTMEEAELIRWLKGVGDFADNEEPVALIETDKVEGEVLSPVAGYIKEIIIEPGAIVEPGQIIARIE